MIRNSIYPNYTSSPPNFPTQNSPIRFFFKYPVFAYSGSRRSAKSEKERLSWMRGAWFWIFSENCQNISAAKCEIKFFFQKLQTQRQTFVIFSRFPANSRIKGCFHLLSSPICSGVIADQKFAGHYSGPCHSASDAILTEINNFSNSKRS